MDAAIVNYRALQQAALTITSELSLDVVLQRLTDLARNLSQARYAALGVAREDRKGLSMFITSGMSDEQTAKIGRWPRGLGLLGLLLSDPRSLRVRNIRQHPKAIGFPVGHPEMTSFLGVPIMFRRRILGNFYLTDKLGAAEFSEDDQHLIEALASLAAVVIENARLYSETMAQLRSKAQEVEKVEAQLRFLVELSALLPSGPILEEPPLEQVLSRASRLLGDACGVYLVNPDGIVTTKMMMHEVPARARVVAEFVDESWDAISDQVIKKNRLVFVSDVSKVSRSILAAKAEDIRQRNISGVLALPIKSDRQTYGVFLSLASQPLELSQDDLAFGQILAERLCTAIENSNLLRQLSDALRARDEFISVATHELKTPTAVLIGYADMAIKSLQTNPERLGPVLETIKKQSARLSVLADELLDVSRIRAGRLELHTERLNLSKFVTAAVHRYQAQLNPEDRVRLKLNVASADLYGEWDAVRVEQALLNLLSNAFKYSPGGGDVEVSVDRLGQGARIAVRDRGMGIPEDQRARIFEPFFRTTTAARAKIGGAGLGLHISKEIVEQHGGKMWFESEENKGSTFYFTLPLA